MEKNDLQIYIQFECSFILRIAHDAMQTKFLTRNK